MTHRLVGALSLLLGAGCAAQTFSGDVEFLRRHTKVVILGDRTGDAFVAVCPEYQGRVMTSTAAGWGSRGHGWINRELIASGERRPHINAYGGEERFWVGPEGGQFSVFFPKDSPFDLAHWQTPAPIDSEPWGVTDENPRAVSFRKRLRLTNRSGAVFELDVQREIRILPGEEIGSRLIAVGGPNVRAVAYETRNRLTNVGLDPWKKETGLLSVWILGMFAPSDATTVVVPVLDAPEERAGPVVNDAYFGKVPADRLKVEPGWVFFRGDGRLRSKIGIPPRRSTGVLGSWDPENGVLTVVQFNQPKGATEYVNSMWELQKEPYAGDASNSYNDGPASPGAAPLGPFYELESSSPALALKPGQSFLHTHRTFHFRGSRDGLDAIAQRAFGIGLDRIEAALPVQRQP